MTPQPPQPERPWRVKPPLSHRLRKIIGTTLRGHAPRIWLPNRPFFHPVGRFSFLAPNPVTSVQGKAIFLEGVWEPEVTDFIASKVNCYDYVIDAGANVGYYTLIFASFAKSVIAVEPHFQSRQELCANLKRNGIGNVYVVAEALYSRDTTLPLSNYELRPSATTTIQDNNVTCTTIDNLLKTTPYRTQFPRVDLIKGDVEGAELHLLKGTKTTIAAHCPDWIIEIHPLALPSFGDSPDGLFRTRRSSDMSSCH